MKTAFLFPGQGAQTVSMGKDIAENFPQAAQTFEKANDILGYDIIDLCFNGPREKLDSTTYSQPAIFTTSAAILEVLKTESPDIKPAVTAGLSMGEYTALYAAGALSFEDTLNLVQQRGKAMQAAADQTDGKMVSIIGLDEEKVQQLVEKARDGEILHAVNFNCPGQIVLSGQSKAADRALALADEFGALKAIPLAVAGAFHTEMMNAAADALARALQNTIITAPAEIQVIANINAEYYQTPEDITSGLIKQLTSPILWQKCMEKLLDQGFTDFYEIGPQRVLTGLMKRIERKTKVKNLSTAERLKKLLEQ